MKSLISFLHNPIWVWKFQSYFGVEKVKVSQVDPDKYWNTVEIHNSSNNDHIDQEVAKSHKKDENLLLYKVSVDIESQTALTTNMTGNTRSDSRQ